jgi:hypothetical protein
MGTGAQQAGGGLTSLFPLSLVRCSCAALLGRTPARLPPPAATPCGFGRPNESPGGRRDGRADFSERQGSSSASADTWVETGETGAGAGGSNKK